MSHVQNHSRPALHIPTPHRQAFFVLSLLASLFTAACSAMGPATVPLGGLVAKDVIDHTKSTASQIMAEGRLTGHALLVTGANEINVASDNVSRMLGSRMNQTLDRLDASERQALEALQELETRTRNLSSGAYDLKDSLVLDVRDIISKLPLSDSDSFYVQRISGLTHIQKKSAYKITVKGLGLGPDSETSRSTIGVYVDGKPAPTVQQIRTEANSLDLRFPVDVLDAYFSPDHPATLGIELVIAREVRKSTIFSRWDKKQYSVPFVITLLPRRAGRLHVRATYPIFDWVPGNRESNSITTGNHHCDSSWRHRCSDTTTPYSVDLKVASTGSEPPTPGDRRLGDARLECTSGPCGYSQNMGVTLSDFNSRARGNFTVHSKPTTWVLSANVSEYKLVAEKSFEREIEFDWDGVISIDIPATTTAGTIDYELINKDTSGFVLGFSDPKLILQFKQDTRGQQGARKIVYQAGSPPSMETE